MQTQQIISSTTGNFFLGTAGMASVEKFSGASFEKLFMALLRWIVKKLGMAGGALRG